MTESDVRAALAALRASLPGPQREDELSTSEACRMLELDHRATERLLRAAGWTEREAKLRNGKRGKVWQAPVQDVV